MTTRSRGRTGPGPADAAGDGPADLPDEHRHDEHRHDGPPPDGPPLDDPSGPAPTGTAADGPALAGDRPGPGTPGTAGGVRGGGTAQEDGDDGSSRDFVTFVVDGETYAFPMEQVEEIIRMPGVVRVPLGPPSLEGLANLRGKVLPVVSLRACCALPAAEADEATRVVVVDGGHVLGFVVDRVSSVTSVDVARIDPAATISATIDSELLSGVIRPAGTDDELVKVLDVHQLVQSQFSMLDDGPPAGGLDLTVQERHGVDGVDDDTLELVSFAVDGQEYALPIDRVQEIVQAPERVTSVPGAGPGVLGLMDLRGRLLPVISLRELFGLPGAALEPQNRIVVVHLPGGERDVDGPAVVGVVMDTVREVLRVPHQLVADLPEFMARAGHAHEVESVCRLEGGRRLVSVLSVERMFVRDDVRQALREVAAEVGGAFTVEEDEDVQGTDDGDDELLVVFRLADEEYGVDVDTVQEIIRVPAALMKVPRSLDFVEGLVNLRGAVLPVVDLRTRLGLERMEHDDRQRIIVLVVGGVRTGFIVDSVTEVLRVSHADLEPAPELSDEQARIISRVANLQGAQRMLMMLEPDHLMAQDQVADLVPHQRRAEEDLAAV